MCDLLGGTEWIIPIWTEQANEFSIKKKKVQR